LILYQKAHRIATGLLSRCCDRIAPGLPSRKKYISAVPDKMQQEILIKKGKNGRRRKPCTRSPFWHAPRMRNAGCTAGVPCGADGAAYIACTASATPCAIKRWARATSFSPGDSTPSSGYFRPSRCHLWTPILW